MRITGTFGLALLLAAAVAVDSGTSLAKGDKKAGGSKGGSAPSASAAEVAKLKAVRLGDPKAGTFKWGMKPEEVMAQARAAVEAKYEPRVEKAKQDPGLQQRLRDEMVKEIAAVKKSFTKFEGQKSGWDVSIIGQEFQQNTAEAVLVTKEDVWTRYFFFFEDGLYKMFLAFNKDALAGKSFQDFGKGMEAKYGNAREVFRDDRVKGGGVKRSLDHYEWSAGGGDRLQLIDRSEFYGVFCMVLYDGAVQDRVVERRKVVNPGDVKRDDLVESVTSSKDKSGADSNDDIIDRVVGKEVKKPGEEKHADIVVPSQTGKAVSPKEVNSKTPASSSEKSSSSSASDSGSKKKGGKKSDNPMDGLEL
jgi:hypothetical protein